MNTITYGALLKDAQAAVATKNIQPAPCAFRDIHITQKQVERFCLGKRVHIKIDRFKQKVKRRLGA